MADEAAYERITMAVARAVNAVGFTAWPTKHEVPSTTAFTAIER